MTKFSNLGVTPNTTVQGLFAYLRAAQAGKQIFCNIGAQVGKHTSYCLPACAPNINFFRKKYRFWNKKIEIRFDLFVNS